ncbi:hypothetical protein C4097_06830 [Clostridioides difficile]|nr:hypothetical protein [Clostridioides difficile]
MIKVKKLNKHSLFFIVSVFKRLRVSIYLLISLSCLLLTLPKQLIYFLLLILLFHSINKLYKSKPSNINFPYKTIKSNIYSFDNIKAIDTYHESEFKDTLFINQVIDEKEYYTLHDFEVDWKVYIEETIINITVVKLFYYDNRTIAKIYVFDNRIDIFFDDSITLEMLYYKLQECSSFSELSSL